MKDAASIKLKDAAFTTVASIALHGLRQAETGTGAKVVVIGLGLLPAYWLSWRGPSPDERGATRLALVTLLAFIVWWSFLVGHVVNDIMGFGS